MWPEVKAVRSGLSDANIVGVVASRPFARFGFFPIGGRSTAIKLRSGDVWVLASTPLTPETKETIDAMGPVK